MKFDTLIATLVVLTAVAASPFRVPVAHAQECEKGDPLCVSDEYPDPASKNKTKKPKPAPKPTPAPKPKPVSTQQPPQARANADLPSVHGGEVKPVLSDSANYEGAAAESATPTATPASAGSAQNSH